MCRIVRPRTAVSASFPRARPPLDRRTRLAMLPARRIRLAMLPARRRIRLADHQNRLADLRTRLVVRLVGRASRHAVRPAVRPTCFRSRVARPETRPAGLRSCFAGLRPVQTTRRNQTMPRNTTMQLEFVSFAGSAVYRCFVEDSLCAIKERTKGFILVRHILRRPISRNSQRRVVPTDGQFDNGTVHFMA